MPLPPVIPFNPSMGNGNSITYFNNISAVHRTIRLGT